VKRINSFNFKAILLLSGLVIAFGVLAQAQPIVVTTGTDSLAVNGQCSFREAIINANDDAATHPDCNAGVGNDIINLPAGAVNLSLFGAGEDAALTGDLDITDTDTLTINGDAGGTSSVRNSSDRIFDVRGASGDVTMNNFTVTSGNAGTGNNGGGIRKMGASTLTLDMMTITANRAGQDGGGVACGDGTVTMQNGTLITRNNANRHGGGFYAGGNCTLNTTNTTFTRNKANASTIPAGGDGGAIMSDFLVTLTDSMIGGIPGTSGTTQDKNTAINGGGVSISSSSGTLTMRSTTVSGNETTNDGGGVHIDTNQSGTSDIENSTISGNRAANDGGGIFHDNASTGALNIINSTITQNRADTTFPAGGDGGGIFNSQGNIELTNTILAENTDPTSQPDCDGTFISIGNNIIGINSDECFGFMNGVNNDQVGPEVNPVDPQLDPLQQVPGRVFAVHPLQSDSPALEGGNNTICTAVLSSLDQRDTDRTADNTDYDRDGNNDCDIGAYEARQLEVFNAVSVRTSRSFAINFMCGEKRVEFDNSGLTHISVEKFDFKAVVNNPEKRLFGLTPGAPITLLTAVRLNTPSGFQVTGEMSEFFQIRLNPGKNFIITCNELLSYPIAFDANGNITQTLGDVLNVGSNPGVMFGGVIVVETASRDVEEVFVQRITQNWSGTDYGIPIFIAGDTKTETETVGPVTVSNTRSIRAGTPNPINGPVGLSAEPFGPPVPKKVKPVAMQTPSGIHFSVDALGVEELQVTIYDLSGQVILDANQQGNALSWHLLNNRSQRVSNGVYLYSVQAKLLGGSWTRTQIKKIVVMN